MGPKTEEGRQIVSWTLTVGPKPQGEVAEALRGAAERYLADHAEDPFAGAEEDQIVSAIAAVDELVERAEFHGKHVTASITGHVAPATGSKDTVSVLLTGEAID